MPVVNFRFGVGTVMFPIILSQKLLFFIFIFFKVFHGKTIFQSRWFATVFLKRREMNMKIFTVCFLLHSFELSGVMALFPFGHKSLDNFY